MSSAWYSIGENRREAWSKSMAIHRLTTGMDDAEGATVAKREECFDWASVQGKTSMEMVSTCEGTDDVCFSDADCATVCRYDPDRTAATHPDTKEFVPAQLPGAGCWIKDDIVAFSANDAANAPTEGDTEEEGWSPLRRLENQTILQRVCLDNVDTCWQLSANDECRRMGYEGASPIVLNDDNSIDGNVACEASGKPSCVLVDGQADRAGLPDCTDRNGNVVTFVPKTCEAGSA